MSRLYPSLWTRSGRRVYLQSRGEWWFHTLSVVGFYVVVLGGVFGVGQIAPNNGWFTALAVLVWIVVVVVYCVGIRLLWHWIRRHGPGTSYRFPEHP